MGDDSVRTGVRFNRDIEQAIVPLKKGAHFLKSGRKGKPKLCHFRLSEDEKLFIWLYGSEEKQLKVSSITNIIPSKVNSHQLPQSEVPYYSFSIIFGTSEESLNLICKDKELIDAWRNGLKSLVSVTSCTTVSSILANGRAAYSYASTPISFARRKLKLGFLENSAKLEEDTSRPLKVNSVCASPSRSLIHKCFSDGILFAPTSFALSDTISMSSARSVITTVMPPAALLVSSGSLSDDKTEHTPSEGCRISLSAVNEGHSFDESENLNDIFLWGEGVEGIFMGCATDRNSSLSRSRYDVLEPRRLESAVVLNAHTISCGGKHAALVTKKGEVFCWGEENGGRLGHKINIDVFDPKLVESVSYEQIESVSCGEFHTCALSHSGEVYIWGGCGLGPLGSESKKSLWSPYKIAGPLEGIQVIAMACGECHTALVSSSGKLLTFGEGTFGALGHGNVQSCIRPREVEALKSLKVISVACGPWHTAAVAQAVDDHTSCNKHSGKLFTWGDGDKGKLGHPHKERKLFPTCVLSIKNNDFAQVACGQTLTIALTTTGSVFTMGSSLHGQLGNPNAKDGSVTIVEGRLKGENVVEISSGSQHVAALTSKGEIYSWGKGANGRLGHGDVEDRNSPSLVETLQDRHVKRVSCGSSFTAVVCAHRAMSSSDKSACSGCKTSFSFTKKKHNCYNCGMTFCNACTSKKSTDASLAPNKSKLYRVCDRCFGQLVKHGSSTVCQETPSSRHRTLMQKLSISNLNIHKSEQSFMSMQIFSPKLCGYEELKCIESREVIKNGRNLKPLSPLSSFSSGNLPRWGQVECPKEFDACQDDSKSFTVSTSTGASGVSPVPSNESQTVSHSLEKPFRGPNRKTVGSTVNLFEQVQHLRAEAKNLEMQCKTKEEKIRHCKENIRETWLVASEEGANCRAAKEAIKVLADRLKDMCEKFPDEAERSKMLLAYAVEVQSLNDRPEIVPSLAQTSGACTPTESANTSPKNVHGRSTIYQNQGVQSHNRKPEGKNHHQNGGGPIKAEEEEHPLYSEWVEQYEPGVYITFMALPHHKRELKRVRFSRRRFSEKVAEYWWAENRSEVYQHYEIAEPVNT